MNEKDILRALGGVDPEFIADAAPKEKLRHRNPMLFRLIAALISVAILMGALFAAIVVPKIVNEMFVPTPSPYGRYVLSLAKYPEMMQMPKREDYASDDAYYDAESKWRLATQTQARLYTDPKEVLPFFTEASKQILAGSDTENAIYSPLNVYMAIAMLGEMTAGETQKEIFELMGVDTIEGLRHQASSLWTSIYCDNGSSKRIVSNSIWLNEKVKFNQTCIDMLADKYYASSFQGDFESKKYIEKYCQWVNDSTGNMFGVTPNESLFDENSLVQVASALYLETLWKSSFASSNTYNETFHTANGDVSASFMHSRIDDNLHAAEDFYAVSKSLEVGGKVWFILPDEDSSVEEVISDGYFMKYAMGLVGRNCREYKINLSIPKFDIRSEKSVTEDIKKLGVTEIFESGADFSPISNNSLAVGDIMHSARLKIDEKGVIGGAHILVHLYGEPYFPPEEEIDFKLDRPFIFVVTSSAGIPIFVGVVNDPTKN
ncbi:MAG: hypothetical protein J6M03_05365 [Clostridia bacterium]|nr:hypothetical protein [Clostridia bacterium]